MNDNFMFWVIAYAILMLFMMAIVLLSNII